MNPFILIPWSLLTHTYDTIKAEKQQRTPMIYLDLLTELQNLSEEDLQIKIRQAITKIQNG